MRKIFIAISVLFLFTTCKDNQNVNHDNIPQIVITPSDSPINLTSLFESIKYVLLDMPNDSFLVGNISKLKVSKDKLFLVASKNIFSYNLSNGSAVFSLKKSGEAPDEYVSIYDIWVDDFIEVLDMNSQKIKQYNHSGNFIQDIAIPSRAFSFYKRDETDYILYNNNMLTETNHHRLTLFNTTSKKIKAKQFPIDEHMAQYFFIREFSNFTFWDNNLYFFSNPTHIQYKLSEDLQITPCYRISFGKRNIPDDFFKMVFFDIAHFSEEAYKREYIYNVNNISENKTHITLSFLTNYGKSKYLSIHNKQNSTTQSSSLFIDDIKFPGSKHAVNITPHFTTDENNFYFLIQPDQFIEMINSYKQMLGNVEFRNYLTQNEDISKIVNSPTFSDQSNPILIICKFKKHEK